MHAHATAAVTDNNAMQAHGIILRMLKIIDYICRKHHLTYWLEYGTLLGAVRHRGFIPWDTEADIGMLRPDFEQLMKVAAAELPEETFFQHAGSDPGFITVSPYIEAKFRDRYSRYPAADTDYPGHTWHNGIQVDIFVYDQDYSRPGVLINAFERISRNRNSFWTTEELSLIARCRFEDTALLVPAGYHHYLQRNYNDYMEYPPPDKQVPEYVEIQLPLLLRKKLTLSDAAS